MCVCPNRHARSAEPVFRMSPPSFRFPLNDVLPACLSLLLSSLRTSSFHARFLAPLILARFPFSSRTSHTLFAVRRASVRSACKRAVREQSLLLHAVILLLRVRSASSHSSPSFILILSTTLHLRSFPSLLPFLFLHNFTCVTILSLQS